MKKALYAAAVIATIAIAGWNYAIAGWNYQQNKEIELSDLAMENANYDADKPKAVKCGTPCKYDPLDIHWWSGTSYCL